MAASEVRYEPRPYVRDQTTLLKLLQMAGEAQQASVRERGQSKGQGLMNIGSLIANAFGSFRQEGEQRNMLAARQAFEQQKLDEANQIKREEMAARAEERGLVEQQRQEVLARQGQLDTRQTAMDLGQNLQPGVIDPRNADALRAYPGTAGRVQVQDGAPVLMRTPQQVAQAETEARLKAQAEQPKAEPNPTEASLALLAANGNIGAKRALEIIRQQRPPAASGAAGPRPLTQTAEAQIINRLSNQWIAANKPMKELDRQVQLMDAGMEAVNRGDMAQGSQAVLVTFQKILDPPSVVRESEYARSSAGLSLQERVKGAYQKLVKGGAGVSPEELQKFASLAREAAAAQRKASGIDAVKSRLGKTAERYNIPNELVFEDGPLEAPPVQTQAPARPDVDALLKKYGGG